MTFGQADVEVAQALDRNRGLFQAIEGEIQLIAIRNRSEQVSDRGRFVPLQHQVAQGKEVAYALRHLLAFDQQEPRVKPETGEGLPRE